MQTSRRLQLDPTQLPKHWWHRWHLSTQKFAIILSAVAFVTGFTYVLLTNDTATKGFAIKDLQHRLDELSVSNEKLELQAADLRSLSLVEQTSQGFALVPSDRVEYLTPLPGSVAVRP